MGTRRFEQMLVVGGKTNSLGKVNDVISEILLDKNLVGDLYECLFSDDPWIRMRAIDALEKICRQHPHWIEPYLDRLQSNFSGPEQQPSIKWHLAEIYIQVTLTSIQKDIAIKWLTTQLASTDTDWIVAANCMKAYVYFVEHGAAPKSELLRLLNVQKGHTSNTIAKKATSLLEAHTK